MKNVSYVINGLFAVAIVVLFVLVFRSNENADKSIAAVDQFAKGDSAFVMPIAYINMDSVISKYNYAIDEGRRLDEEAKKVVSTLEGREKQLMNEIDAFRKRLQRNAFLSEDQYNQEQERIGKLQTNYEELRQRLMNERGADAAKINGQIADSVLTCVKLYNERANYQVIFNNTHLDNILIADDAYDVTDELVALLNSRYAKK